MAIAETSPPNVRSYVDVLMSVDDRPRRVPEGEVLFSQGDPADAMYLVRSGVLRVWRDGERIETLGPGSVVGEMGLVDRAPRSATAIAGPDCWVTEVDERLFARLVTVPGFALELLRVVVRRLRTELQREQP